MTTLSKEAKAMWSVRDAEDAACHERADRAAEAEDARDDADWIAEKAK